MAYVNENFGRPGTLCAAGEAGARVREQERKIDAIPIDVLAVGVACFWPEGVTERLHSQFVDPATRERNIERLSVRSLAKMWARGCEIFQSS